MAQRVTAVLTSCLVYSDGGSSRQATVLFFWTLDRLMRLWLLKRLREMFYAGWFTTGTSFSAQVSIFTVKKYVILRLSWMKACLLTSVAGTSLSLSLSLSWLHCSLLLDMYHSGSVSALLIWLMFNLLWSHYPCNYFLNVCLMMLRLRTALSVSVRCSCCTNTDSDNTTTVKQRKSAANKTACV